MKCRNDYIDYKTIIINIPGNIHAFWRVKHHISISIVRIKQKPDKVGRLL